MPDCHTRYPLLFLHGVGFHDRLPIHYYWGRIPHVLKKHGAEVCFGNQDGNATIEHNSRYLCSVIEQICRTSGAEKVNIIAHSKGGLEARYLISSLGMADRIASVTTLCTPHHGSVSMDYLMQKFPRLIRFGSFITDIYRKIAGDKKPETFRVMQEFTTEYMTGFNQQNPDAPGVFYQSYAFVMKHWYSDVFMWWEYLIVKAFEGENDGLLTPANARWTNFRGVYSGTGLFGISHPGATDYLRLPMSRKRPETNCQISDMTDFYLHLIAELKNRGF